MRQIAILVCVVGLTCVGQLPVGQFSAAGRDLVTSNGPASADNAVSRASTLELQGRFKEAAGIITDALHAADLPDARCKALDFELDRLERIKKDYPFDRPSLFKALQKSVSGLTADEYTAWVDDGRFDSRMINGQRRFMSSSVSNLFFRYPELKPRRTPLVDKAEVAKRFWENCRNIKKVAMEQKTPYVPPTHFHAKMSLTVSASTAPRGEIVRAWLPIPRHYPYQDGFQLTSSSPTARQVAGPESLIRSAYFEQTSNGNGPVQFKIEYDYTRSGVWFDIKPESVVACDRDDPSLRAFLREGPHVVFTPEMRELSRQIVGAETNDCRKAKRIYDWIAEHVKYSFAIEYSTVRNLGDYCRAHCYGDCGQEAMLFITLCRLNGVPARWQSGWNTFPGDKDIHDWSEIYLAPADRSGRAGWMPVDPYMGLFAMRYATSLSADQRRELRDFYFGGMDQYRMAANGDHCQELTPPKQSMRSDNVDFQRGEVECGRRNVYFDDYSYEWSVEEIKVPREKAKGKSE